MKLVWQTFSLSVAAAVVRDSLAAVVVLADISM